MFWVVTKTWKPAEDSCICTLNNSRGDELGAISKHSIQFSLVHQRENVIEIWNLLNLRNITSPNRSTQISVSIFLHLSKSFRRLSHMLHVRILPPPKGSCLSCQQDYGNTADPFDMNFGGTMQDGASKTPINLGADLNHRFVCGLAPSPWFIKKGSE